MLEAMDVAGIVGVIGMIGGIIARDRYIARSIQEGDHAERKHVDNAVEKLHERINTVRDTFVRRDDLNEHMQRVEKLMDRMAVEQSKTNERLDQFITVALAGQGKK